MPDSQDASTFTRREFLNSFLVAVGSALLVGILWLVTRGAPSATRDPAMRPPMLVPTRTPQPPATPVQPAIS